MLIAFKEEEILRVYSCVDVVVFPRSLLHSRFTFAVSGDRNFPQVPNDFRSLTQPVGHTIHWYASIEEIIRPDCKLHHGECAVEEKLSFDTLLASAIFQLEFYDQELRMFLQKCRLQMWTVEILCIYLYRVNRVTRPPLLFHFLRFNPESENACIYDPLPYIFRRCWQIPVHFVF